MHFTTVALALAAARAVSAHTLMTTMYVDGMTQGDGVCVRMNLNHQASTNHVPNYGNLDAKEMACGKCNSTLWRPPLSISG